MTSKVDGKTEILTPCRSETPENIEAKLGVNDYVVDPYNLANFVEINCLIIITINCSTLIHLHCDVHYCIISCC